MLNFSRPVMALGVALIEASSVAACPFCDSETGRQVRAGIFNDHFGYNLFLTVLPFPIFLGIVAAIHFGLPFRAKNAGRQVLRPGLDVSQRPSSVQEGHS
jgi:hypothetical protein